MPVAFDTHLSETGSISEGTCMELDRLSWRAQCKLEMYVKKMSQRAFDSNDIELFLVYAREAFRNEKHSVIAGFGDTMAHSIRNRGRLQDISRRLLECPDAILRGHVKKPLGDNGCVDDIKLRREINELFHKFNLGDASQEVFDDIKLCLCVISNQTLLTINKRGKEKAIGEARLILLDEVASLDVESYDRHTQIITLQAPIQGFKGRFVDVGKHYAYARREEPGKPLEVIFEGADIDCANDPEPYEPTQEQIVFAKKFKLR
jgi:hypothetical protein